MCHSVGRKLGDGGQKGMDEEKAAQTAYAFHPADEGEAHSEAVLRELGP
jgi:hypothetical protein